MNRGSSLSRGSGAQVSDTSDIAWVRERGEGGGKDVDCRVEPLIIGNSNYAKIKDISFTVPDCPFSPSTKTGALFVNRLQSWRDLLKLKVSGGHGYMCSGPPRHQHSLDTLTASHSLVHYTLQRNGLPSTNCLVCCHHHTRRGWEEE